MLPNLFVEPADSFGVVRVDAGTGLKRHSQSEVIRGGDAQAANDYVEDAENFDVPFHHKRPAQE
jgi:hypothetical protein